MNKINYMLEKCGTWEKDLLILTGLYLVHLTIQFQVIVYENKEAIITSLNQFLGV